MRTAAIYNFLIESTLIASIAIVLMAAIRKFFRPALGNRALCFAWLLVAVRLLCPLALPNPVIHEIQTPYNYDQAAVRPIAGQIEVRFRDALDSLYSRAFVSSLRQSGSAADPQRVFDSNPLNRSIRQISNGMYDGKTPRAVMRLYLAGAAGVIGWFIASNVLFRRKLKRNRIEPISGELLAEYQALCQRQGVKPLPVYLTDPLPGACLVGLIRPYIALPASASPQDAAQMLLHETWHAKARDPWWTLLQLICCAVHWFNPLVWLAAAMCRMDRELKCDDNVTRAMTDEEKRAYAQVLVQSAARKAMPGLPVVATGMSMTGRKLKTRVASILRGGKRAAAFSLAFVITASLLLVCAFATVDPQAEGGMFAEMNYETEFALAIDWKNLPVTRQPALTIPDTDAALNRAMAAYKSDYMAFDLTDGTWTVQYQADGFVGYPIEGAAGGQTFHAYVQPDGGMSYIDVSYPDDAKWGEYIGANTTDIPELDKIAAYALNAAEFLEPGITSRMSDMFCDALSSLDEHQIIYFTLVVPGENARDITVEYSPVFRVWSYGKSNG